MPLNLTLAEAYLRLNRSVAEAIVPDSPLGEGEGDPFCDLHLRRKLRALLEETLGLLGLVFEEPDPSVFDPQCEKNLSFARLSEPGGCRVVLLEIQSGVLKVADGANGRAFNSLQLILGNEAESLE